MTPDEFRTLALAFPEAVEAPHFERTSFRVAKKIFATMKPDGSEAMVRVHPQERLNALMADFPEAFFSYGGWTTNHRSLGVRLAAVEPLLLRELLAGSWAHSAPKRLQKPAP